MGWVKWKHSALPSQRHHSSSGEFHMDREGKDQGRAGGIAKKKKKMLWRVWEKITALSRLCKGYMGGS